MWRGFGILALLCLLGANGSRSLNRLVHAEPVGVGPSLACDSTYASRPMATDLVSEGPQLVDVKEAQAAVFDGYQAANLTSAPNGLRMWILIDDDGVVVRSELYRSSGLPAVDSVALQSVQQFRFHPATYRGEAICYWLNVPIPAPGG